MGWFSKLYQRCLSWSDSKYGEWALFTCAFLDACCLPLPTPTFFVALMLLNTAKAYKFALYGTIGTLTGSFLGYAIGHFAWFDASGHYTIFAQFMLDNIPGFSASFYDKIKLLYDKWDFWILFVASFVPVPYKIFSISSGVFNINILIFGIATFLSQGIKFYLLALITTKIGHRVKKLLEFNFKPIAIGFALCVIAVFLFLKIY
jgi:membrane protein YqaA with SNARE-associated domain